MDKFKFQEGGLPLTIEYLQAIEKRFEALEKIAQFLTPEGHVLFPDDASGKYRGGLRLSGMELTQDEDNNTIQISAGYVLIDGEIVEVKQSGILPAGEGEKLWLHPVVENTPAIYKDGSTKPFEVKKYFTIDKIQSEGAIEFNPFAFAVDNAKEFRLIAKSKIKMIDNKIGGLDANIENLENNAITTAGSGLSKTDNTLNHSSSITASSTYIGGSTSIPRLQYNDSGHLTAVSTSTVYPPTSAGTSGQYWRSTGSGQGTWQTLSTSPTSGSTVAITSGAVYTALHASPTLQYYNYSSNTTAVGTSEEQLDYQSLGKGKWLIVASATFNDGFSQNGLELKLRQSSTSGTLITYNQGLSGATIAVIVNISSSSTFYFIGKTSTNTHGVYLNYTCVKLSD